MGLTAFPNGVSSFGMPVMGVGEETMTTGNVFFVDSGATNSSDGNLMDAPDRPGATINGAMDRCTANNGDIIFVMPGHSEDPLVSITMDVAGVWVRGLGWGADRPTITFGALAATFAMSAASTRISNIIFDLGTVATTVTNAITITGASVIVENCETLQHASSQFTNFLITTAAATNLTLRGNRFRGLMAASGTTALTLVGCVDLTMVDNEITGAFSTGAVAQITTAAQNVYIANNSVTNASAFYAIDLHDDTTGTCIKNNCSSTAAFGAVFDPGDTFCVENYSTDLIAVVTGGVVPTTVAS